MKMCIMLKSKLHVVVTSIRTSSVHCLQKTSATNSTQNAPDATSESLFTTALGWLNEYPYSVYIIGGVD